MSNTQEVRFKDLITPGDICKSTTNAWLWYCDDHDTHGNADSHSEADAIAEAHMEFQTFAANLSADEEMEDDEDYPDLQPEDVCTVFLIDVSNMITYNYGDNYKDKTPNRTPVDLEKAAEIRRRLGLLGEDN